jgi:predicted unusual protein kinase regulating ubiquinone biosynthesis (AarF/ABC1/UbiB family)
MTDKNTGKIQRNALLRGLTLSVAGARTGGAVIADSALNKLIPGRSSNKLLRKEANNFARELGRLKGTYAKVGQMMALLGEHFLPIEITDALHTLESQTSPLPWSEIKSVLQARLGKKFNDLNIEQQPLATASLAQVHRAEIKATGEKICLKILYPGVRETIDADFNAVVTLLKLTRIIKVSRDLSEWLESIREQLHKEADYKLEAEMTRKMTALLENDSRYRVPCIYAEFCSEEILALEYMDGVSVSSTEVSRLSLKRRNRLAESMLDLFFYEVYQWKLVQTDPNFGNYLISIDDKQDQLVLLDFGSVMEISEGFSAALGSTIHAGQAKNKTRIIEGLIKLGCLKPDSPAAARETFADFCLQLLEPLRNINQLPISLLNTSGEYRWGHSALIKRVGKTAAKSSVHRDFSLPSQEFAFIARKLTGVFTFIAVLEAEFNGAPLLLKHKAT